MYSSWEMCLGTASSQVSCSDHSFCSRIFASMMHGLIKPKGSKIVTVLDRIVRLVTGLAFKLSNLQILNVNMSCSLCHTKPRVLPLSSFELEKSTWLPRRSKFNSSKIDEWFEFHFGAEILWHLEFGKV